MTGEPDHVSAHLLVLNTVVEMILASMLARDASFGVLLNASRETLEETLMRQDPSGQPDPTFDVATGLFDAMIERAARISKKLRA